MKRDIWISEDGKRRRAKRTACETCKKGFLQRKSGTKRFCSRKCRDVSLQNREELKCFTCGRKFFRPIGHIKKSKHGIFFCRRKCKDKGQRLESGCREIWPSHYGKVDATGIDYRSKMERELKRGCVDCGEKTHYMLTVHHIDGNRGSREKSNWEVVCWNHHAKRHLRKTASGWVVAWGCLTPRRLLKKIR